MECKKEISRLYLITEWKNAYAFVYETLNGCMSIEMYEKLYFIMLF